MSPGAADFNLLFGIMAVQNDFVSRDALIEAMSAWVLDKGRALGDILVERGALSAERHALLTALVTEHVKVHHDDPQHSLRAISSAPSLHQHLSKIADADVQGNLALVATTDFRIGARPADRSADPEATTPELQALPGLRYRILRPHAKGGLGEVFVAEDVELHRQVALKEIQPVHAQDPVSRGRFLLEAEITGRLEHPGIVPVYGLGQYADGRPFYAMRFIHGDNLKEAIRRFHEGDQPGRDPGERGLAFRELLGRFVDVCNAVAYAHSRGVLHRDLKPGNIMLGKYGETLVVDWGLAKAGVTDHEVGNGDPIDESMLRPSSGSGVAATQMGSAIGTPAYMSPEQAGGRLDKLGPASDMYSLGATFYCLLTGKPPFGGNDHGQVLDKVRRGEFPAPRLMNRSVPAVLEAICLKAMALRPEERYPTARALAEDIEHWLADEPVRAYREPWTDRARRWGRRHRPLVAATTALSLAVLIFGGGTWMWWKQQRDTLARAVREDLTSAEDNLSGEHWLEAGRNLERAEGRLASGGPADLLAPVRQLRDDLTMVAKLAQIRLEKAVVKDGHFRIEGADPAYRAAFEQHGLPLLELDPAEAARRINNSIIARQLVTALDDWAFIRQLTRASSADHLFAIARLVDPDPWRQQLRQAVEQADPLALKRLAVDEKALIQPAGTLDLLQEALFQFGAEQAIAPLLRQVQQRHPADFWINHTLAVNLCLQKPPDTREAIGYLRAALVIRPDNPGVLLNFGNALKDQGRLDEAIAAFQKAIEQKPDYAEAYIQLGSALVDQKRLADAEAAFHKAIELKPKDAGIRADVGYALEAAGKLADAEAAYRKAIQLDPQHARGYNNLGHALYQQQRLEPAIEAYRKAIELKSDFALAYVNLAAALADLKKLPEALAACRKAIELQPDYPDAYGALGDILGAQQKVSEAIEAYQKAISLKPDYAQGYNNLGLLFSRQHRVAEATAALRKAIELRPDYSTAHYNLGMELQRQGQLDDAEAAYRSAIALSPNYARAYCNLGYILKTKGQFREALAAYERGHELGSQSPGWRYPSDQWVRGSQRLIELDAKLPNVLMGHEKPGNATEQSELAWICRRPSKKLYAAAARFYNDAFAAEPKLAEDLKQAHRYDAACAAALAGCGRGVDAAPLDEEARARLRQQALAWLRADLAAWKQFLEKQADTALPTARQTLATWQQDSDLSGVRGHSIAKLPLGEQEGWRKLWADVEALRQHSAAPK
jgi:eukaryotic-like serine/threonine-protein kinase